MLGRSLSRCDFQISSSRREPTFDARGISPLRFTSQIQGDAGTHVWRLSPAFQVARGHPGLLLWPKSMGLLTSPLCRSTNIQGTRVAGSDVLSHNTNVHRQVLSNGLTCQSSRPRRSFASLTKHANNSSRFVAKPPLVPLQLPHFYTCHKSVEELPKSREYHAVCRSLLTSQVRGPL